MVPDSVQTCYTVIHATYLECSEKSQTICQSAHPDHAQVSKQSISVLVMMACPIVFCSPWQQLVTWHP